MCSLPSSCPLPSWPSPRVPQSSCLTRACFSLLTVSVYLEAYVFKGGRSGNDYISLYRLGNWGSGRESDSLSFQQPIQAFLIPRPKVSVSEQESSGTLKKLQGDELGTIGLTMNKAISGESPPALRPQCMGPVNGSGGERPSLKDVPKENISGAQWLVEMWETKRRKSQIHIIFLGTERGPVLALQQERQPEPLPL